MVGLVRRDNVQQSRTVKMETENENMCQVIAGRYRYPLGYILLYMCPTVKARESVGRLVKLAVRHRKFTTHKKTHDFEYK